MAEQQNAEFYVNKKQNYLNRKFGKIKRDIKTGSSTIVSMLTKDYSPEKINESWKGKPTRFALINELIKMHGYKNYLEIGCSSDDCFKAITAESKIGVDPFHGGTHRMTSDDFFASNDKKFDIIFIDGLHQYEQVRKDMLNSVEVLNDNGVILVHDCLPLNYKAQLPFPPGGDWNGDVWKAFVEMRTLDNIDSAVSLIDHGVGIIKKRPNTNKPDVGTSNFLGLKFKDFVANYRSWLNTLDYADTIKFAEN